MKSINNTGKTIKLFWEQVVGQRLSFFVIVFSVALANIASAIVPIYYKNFFDVFASAPTPNENVMASLIHALILIALFQLFRWIFWRTASFVNTRFQPTVIKKLTDKCFTELHKHSFSYFSNNFVGSLVKRVNYFTRSFESISDRFFWDVVPLISSLGIIIVVLFLRSTAIGFGVIAWIVIFLIFNSILTKYKLKYDIIRSEAETKSTGILADTITNSQNVKLFVGYQRETDNFGSATENVRKLRQFTWSLDSIFDAIQGFLALSLEIGIMYLSIRLWGKGLLTLGDFVLIQSYLGTIIDRTWGFGAIIRNIYSNLADAEEMTILLNTPIEINNVTNAKELIVKNGKIEFKNIGFNYNETRQIISKLSLDILPKQKIAFVGSSGSGKTTLTKLLLRMYDLTAGSIEIDDNDISKVTQESLWANISMVPQEPILFHRSLMENIRYGKPGATDEEVIEAAKIAHCHEFIIGLSESYDTFVGERGIKLSGGERQRVAIARAVLRNAPILILDEATSSLDSESESLIQDALNSLMKDKTVIVIAHRLSTIMKMDRIVVIDKGNIIEDGTHTELLNIAGGIYNNLWKIQAGGFISTDEEEVEFDSLQEKATVTEE